MIASIRPWQMFSKLGNNNKASLVIPTVPGRESESVMSLETLLLITAARLVNAERILELGTSLGYTSMHLAMNTNAAIVTVDRESKPCVFENTKWESHILRLEKDVAEVQIPWRMDMAFCDINYTSDTVKHATEVACSCGAKVVAWHDYGHPELPHMKPWLDDFSRDRNMFHVADSSLVFWFKEPIL